MSDSGIFLIVLWGSAAPIKPRTKEPMSMVAVQPYQVHDGALVLYRRRQAEIDAAGRRVIGEERPVRHLDDHIEERRRHRAHDHEALERGGTGE